MSCRQYKKGRYIERYLQGELSAREAGEFEKHCFACDACFQDLRTAETIIGILRESPRKIYQDRERVGRHFLLRPAFALIGAAFVLLLLFFFIFQSSQKQQREKLARLAVIDAPPFISGEIRSLGERAEFGRLFVAAMRLYQNHDYNGAASRLKEALGQDPENPQAQYYLGISLLAGGRPEEALVHFAKLIGSGPPAYREDSLWYGAMASLRSGEATRAKTFLQELVKTESRHATKAAGILAQMERLLPP